MKLDFQSEAGSVRCINVVNFIRGNEPRFEIDLMLAVRKQMELVLEHKLPATWLLQYDALVAGPFVEFLKTNMAKGHEVGFWFEMNEKLVRAAGVEWRGRPGYEWDHLPPVAFTIGYTPEERIKLADTAMAGFKSIWGKYPSSVASWNLDSLTIAHLSEHYGVDAYAVCRDQIATDGFTIWGAPIAGYYPSKKNCWSPALSRENQIGTPIFRMLGQDPVYYYSGKRFKGPNGKIVQGPDTMEPVWITGQTQGFIDKFLTMIATTPTLKFAYAQLGQENSFPWQDTAVGYPMQMKALAALRDSGAVHVETMGESGRRFKKAFKATPVQAQIMLEDPFGNAPGESTVWYQSRFYRGNLHFRGDLPYLRDLTVYSDRLAQPFLTKATRENDVEQRMPPVLDGYHWSKKVGSLEEIGSGAFFVVGGERLRSTGKPRIREEGSRLLADVPVTGGRVLHVVFEEQKVSISLSTKEALSLSFEWDASKAALVEVQPQRVMYRWQDFEYWLGVSGAVQKADGFVVTGEKGEISLRLAQST